MDFTRDSEIAEILYRKLISGITSEEQRTLELWYERSPENRRLYDGFMSGKIVGEYDDLLAGLDLDSRKACIDRKIYRNNRRRLAMRLSSAAVLLAGIVSAALLLRPDVGTAPSAGQQHVILSIDDGREIVLTEEEQGIEWKKHVPAEEQTHTLKISVPTGSEYRLTLGDGTAVWLNSETVFEYPAVFTGGSREVKLSGEGYFEVARNEEMPFTVTAPNDVQVTVLGTSFNLSAYGADRESVATLVTGAVEVCSGTECVQLTPGRQAVIDNSAGGIVVAEVDTKLYTSWTQGVFEFDMMPLEDVAARLSRWYDVRFVFEGDSGRKLFTGGTWRSVPLEKFLERIEMVASVSFRFDGDTVTVSSN